MPWNIFIGQDAGLAVTTTGGSNVSDGTVGIGHDTLKALTSGARNTAVGYQSLMTEDTGSYHTSLGYQALKVVVTSLIIAPNLQCSPFL